jgi:hypothetical protein
MAGERTPHQSAANHEDSSTDAESSNHLFRSWAAGRVSLFWLLDTSWQVHNKSINRT